MRETAFGEAMTTDEESLAIGRLVTAHEEARRKMIILRAEMESVSRELGFLQTAILNEVMDEDRLANMPSAAKIKTLRQELGEQSALYEGLKEKLRSLGLTV